MSGRGRNANYRKADVGAALGWQGLRSANKPTTGAESNRAPTVERKFVWNNGWHRRSRDLFHSTVGQRVQHKLNSIADSQFVVDPHERLLDRIFFDAQSLRDRSVTSPICHQADDLLLSCSQKTLSLSVDDPCRGAEPMASTMYPTCSVSTQNCT
jgi:hypothetical protein